MPAATCVLDLIQFHQDRTPIGVAKAVRLRASVRAARALFTINSAVREELIGTFDLDPGRITLLELPVDGDSAARVAARRSAGTSPRYLLAVGRFDRHKNLPRLVEAFAQTRFAAAGGQLHLVGGTTRQLVALGLPSLPANVRVLGTLDQRGLEDALAGAVALVHAAVVEGYGLPVAEALSADVPVVSSPVPAVTEFGPPGVPTFDPRSLGDIRDTIDDTVELIDSGGYWHRVDRDGWAAARPTTRLLAQQVVDGLARALATTDQ
jgi:glycosyltransferase involved in cell wall biosynthesis